MNEAIFQNAAVDVLGQEDASWLEWCNGDGSAEITAIQDYKILS